MKSKSKEKLLSVLSNTSDDVISAFDSDQYILNRYSSGFEKDHIQRSEFIRFITLKQQNEVALATKENASKLTRIPKKLVTYWHDPNDIPADVQQCIDSWDILSNEGVEILKFNDISAKSYIASKYGSREVEAFSRCRHPAMRSDYFRMCFVFSDGGLYVDADDVLIGDVFQAIFHDNRLKIQPFCYDITTQSMLPVEKIWHSDLPINNRIFYVNNNPIAAPPNHPLLRRALTRATDKLLKGDVLPEIQSTTGPGNLTESLAAHALEILKTGSPVDFELLQNWNTVAETRWELSYRNDLRNWRNMI